MTQAQAKAGFAGMPPDQQQRVLVLLALNVTVAARAAYPGPVDERQVAGKLRAFNEVLHTIAGQLLHLIEDDSNRYPDDELVDALFERARQGNCESDLADAISWSLTAASPV